MDPIHRLTQYSHGAGCGCKISPKLLEEILKQPETHPPYSALLVGNESRDDAAVYDLGNGTAIISTTDFFMPIVDDAFDFGRIAAANAISDVYAMGGTPLMAISILGWPVDKLPAALAGQVVEGGKTICREAHIPLAGGHSIDSPEPIFGLAVTGIVQLAHLKKNNSAHKGDLLFLTKPLGTGILSTAQKKGLLDKHVLAALVGHMTALNRVGEKLGKLPAVTAMTDITGFGLLGHLLEMTNGSNLSVELHYEKVPKMAGVQQYLAQRIFPDATSRNWNSYSPQVTFQNGVNVAEAFLLLPDPQTNGGLLFSVQPSALDEVKALLNAEGLKEFTEPVGRFVERSNVAIRVSR